MMHHHRVAAGALIILLLTVPPVVLGGPARNPGPPAAQVVLVKREGDAYCFARTMAVGSVTIAGGQCYTYYLLRNEQGAFLALGPGGPPMIPRGQLVRLNTPAGAKVRGRLFYLIPVIVPVAVVQVNEIKFVPVVVNSQPDRVVVTVPISQISSQPTSGDSGRDPEVAFTQR